MEVGDRTRREFEDRKTIYYLESIARNLTELASVIEDIPVPSMGSEVLADNRNWLADYIAELKSAKAA